MEQITWKLDRLENDFLPQVEIGSTEVCRGLHICMAGDDPSLLSQFIFTNVKFGEPQSQQFTAMNVGQRPVHVSFTAKPDSSSVFSPWMDVKPSSVLIQPGKQQSIQPRCLVPLSYNITICIVVSLFYSCPLSFVPLSVLTHTPHHLWPHPSLYQHFLQP